MWKPSGSCCLSAARRYYVLVGNDWLRQAEAILSCEEKQISHRIGLDPIAVSYFGSQHKVIGGAHYICCYDTSAATFYTDHKAWHLHRHLHQRIAITMTLTLSQMKVCMASRPLPRNPLSSCLILLFFGLLALLMRMRMSAWMNLICTADTSWICDWIFQPLSPTIPLTSAWILMTRIANTL